MLYPCNICIDLSIYLFVLCITCLTVFGYCLVKQFVIFLGAVVILLLNIMELLSMWGGAQDSPCMVFKRVCVVPVIQMCI